MERGHMSGGHMDPPKVDVCGTVGITTASNSMLEFPFILKIPTIISGTEALSNLLWTSN